MNASGGLVKDDMIGAVLFDLDETLLDRTTSLKAFLFVQYTEYADRLGAFSFNEWRDRFLELDLRGHTPKSIVYPQILSEAGGDHSLSDQLLTDYQERCCEHARGFSGMKETLEALRTDGRKLGIITNGETAFQTRHIKALRIAHLFDTILISETERLRKPDVKLFERASERLNVAPRDCLFVGDNPIADIIGAHGAGMRTAWIARGFPWPVDAPANPGASLEELPDLLALVRATS